MTSDARRLCQAIGRIRETHATFQSMIPSADKGRLITLAGLTLAPTAPLVTVTRRTAVLYSLSLLTGCSTLPRQMTLDSQRSEKAPLHYAVEGNGPPIVLLHGFGQTSYSWRHVAPALSDFTVYTLDLKGFGLSPKPHDGRYSLHDQAALVSDFISDNNLKNSTIIGHSMGGGIAILTALRLQDSPHAVSRLILIDTIAYPQRIPTYIGLLRTPLINRLVQSTLPPKFQVYAVMRVAFHDNRKIPAEALARYAASLNSPGARSALLATARQLIPDNIENTTRLFSSLDIPTLIIWGRNDRIVPLAVGEQLHSVLPTSDFQVIDNTGHIPHEESPEATTKLIKEFLKRS